MKNSCIFRPSNTGSRFSWKFFEISGPENHGYFVDSLGCFELFGILWASQISGKKKTTSLIVLIWMQKSLCEAVAQHFLRYRRIKDVNECQCQVVAAVVLPLLDSVHLCCCLCWTLTRPSPAVATEVKLELAGWRQCNAVCAAGQVLCWGSKCSLCFWQFYISFGL